MLTANDVMGDIEHGFNKGANEYITKPYDWKKLHHTIKKYVKPGWFCNFSPKVNK